MKKVSAKERLEIYENFFSHLHFVRHVIGSERRVLDMLVIADQVAVSGCTHNAAGQPLSEEVIANNVTAALLAMKECSK